MKTRLLVLIFGMATGLAFHARSDVAFSAGIQIGATADFYQPLGSYGAWVDVRPYGRCWHPARVEVGWRPYTVGHWEWTDVGWYWVSDEPWSWACYHYGSWVVDPSYGWVWIPGTEWAPAWVTWRDSDDYIGWAPCGPGGVALSASWFVFTDVHHFHNHFQPSTLIVNNTTIISRTRVVGSFSRETRSIGGAQQRIVVNQGPRVDAIQRATGAKFNPVPVNEVIRQTPVPANVRRGRQEERSREGAVQEAPREQTGREQPRVYQEPARPAKQPQQAPVTREPRTLPEAQPRSPSERPAQVAPDRTPPPAAPGEKPPSPTGRERGYEKREGQPPPAARPPVRQSPPPTPQGPPPEGERGRGHDKDKDNP